jgi:hypothetical protein
VIFFADNRPFSEWVVGVGAGPILGNRGCERQAATFEAVRALGLEFPDLHESTMYGSPALKLGKRLVACLAIHRSAELGSLVVRTDFEQRPALISDDPETYVTDRYMKHPVALSGSPACSTTSCATFSPPPDSAFSLTPSIRARRAGGNEDKGHGL